MIKLIQDDCLTAMKGLEADCVDLTITSPPYDNLRTYKNLNWSEDVWKQLIEELYRVTKDGGVVVWVVGDETKNGSESLTAFRQALYAKSIGFNAHDTMIYMKDNPPPVGGQSRYYQAFEYMFVWSKGKPKTFNPLKLPRRNKWNDKRTVRTRPVTRNKEGFFEPSEVKVNTGMVKLQNVWSYVVSGGSVATDKVAHKHPAIFPESLVRDHILSWSNEGDTVLDPLMGSGTTGYVAKSRNRNFIGIEKVEEYFNIAKSRIG